MQLRHLNVLREGWQNVVCDEARDESELIC